MTCHIGVARRVYRDAGSIVATASSDQRRVRQHWIDHKFLGSIVRTGFKCHAVLAAEHVRAFYLLDGPIGSFLVHHRLVLDYFESVRRDDEIAGWRELQRTRAIKFQLDSSRVSARRHIEIVLKVL